MSSHPLMKATAGSSSGGPLAVQTCFGRWHGRSWLRRYHFFPTFFFFRNRVEFSKHWSPLLFHQQVSPLKKFYMIYSFFLVRRVVAPTVAFVLYNVIIPLSVMIPEIFLPVWGVAYIPTALTIVTAIRMPELVPLTSITALVFCSFFSLWINKV